MNSAKKFDRMSFAVRLPISCSLSVPGSGYWGKAIKQPIYRVVAWLEAAETGAVRGEVVAQDPLVGACFVAKRGGQPIADSGLARKLV